MRYYDISITEPGSGNEVLHYTSHPRGNDSPPDPGALQLELDILLLQEDQSSANSQIQIWGVPFSVVSSGVNLNFKNCTIRGGMGKGLPLANPKQAGIIGAGQIIQCFGNWIGTDMTLTIILQPGYAPEQKNQEPRNLTMNWRANTPMKDMIDQTLQTGFPGLKRQINISDNLKLPNAETGVYGRLPQFAQVVNGLSRKIIGAQNYTGVHFYTQGDTIYVYDGSGTGANNVTKQIQPTDLIGQPNWIAPQMVQVTTVMRGDIKVGDTIQLPAGLITTQPSAWSSFSNIFRTQPSFSGGTFWVQRVRHVGSFRQPDGRAWVTVFDTLFQSNTTFDPYDLGPGYGVQTGPNYG